MEEENIPTKTFIRVAVPENTCLQCGKLIDNPALRRKLFSGKQKTKTCQSLELLLGEEFAPGPTTPDQKTKRTTFRKSNSALKMQDLLYTLFSPQLYITLKVLI